MEDKIQLGFIGAGFVGGAMIRGFSGYNPMEVYDKGKGIGSLRGVAEFADVIFISVPTPMNKDGSCDTRIIQSVIGEIDEALSVAGREEDKVEVVIRSTVPPEFLNHMKQYTNTCSILFIPEFLTERTSDLDFINAPRFIIGTNNPENPDEYMKTVQVFEERFPKTRIPIMTFTEASLVKYGTNNFFCIKLSYFNEVYRVAKEHGVENPNDIIEEILQDGRIGRSHFQTPGHDGDFGWGGQCFPKDNRAFSHISGSEYNEMVNAAWEVNNKIRQERDWEKDIGRAVSEEFNDD